jgi:Domain of unknown function (DUF2828)
MAALVQALDSFTPIRNGENNHAELGWSNEIQEKIVQFDFQCVRTDSNGVRNLSYTLDYLLLQIEKYTGEKKNEYLLTLYKIIGKTRDIEGGKGEYSLAYMMIWVWYHHFPILAETALKLFVMDPKDLDGTNNSQVPYGSWKDIKYFCKYMLEEQKEFMDHPLIQSCISGINSYLRRDNEILQNGVTTTLSLAAKWVPREDSKKFGFLYDALAANYFPEFIASAKTDNSKMKALKKCRTQYRILCSKLNKHLDTVQIKQTSNSWASIDHSKTTSITMAKQRKAFLNQKRDGQQRSEKPDRVQCAENLRNYLESLKTQGKEVKGKNVGLEMFASQALSMFEYSYDQVRNQQEADILNSQWRDNSEKKNANGLGPMIAMVDISGSMVGDPIHAAISLGCRVAEKSILGSRLITFSAEPSWINLDGNYTFTEMVGTIMRSSNSAGMNTNFYKALDMILNAIEERKVPPPEVENMILAIFSDMQIDDNLSCMNGGSYNPNESQKMEARGKWDIMFQQIKKKYADTGMRLYGKPLNPPHILFWNLRNTNGFPTLSTEANCSMMSGFDPTILNMFCELGIDALKNFTPYMILERQINNPRYTPLEKAFNTLFKQ